MDCLIVICVFVEVIDSGSQIVVVECLDMFWVMVLCYFVELEEWVGVCLLYCSICCLSLIDVGVELLLQCCEMFVVVDVMQVIGQICCDSLCGILCIISSLFFVQVWLICVVVVFVECYLGIVIDLQVNSQVVNLVEECIDLVLCIVNQFDFNLIVCCFGECCLVICVVLDYLCCYGILWCLEDLVLYNCLIYFYFGCSFWQFECDGELISVLVGGSFSVNEFIVLLEVVVVGVGISQQLLYLVVLLICSGCLVVLLLEWLLQVFGIYVVYVLCWQMLLVLWVLLDFLVEWMVVDLYWDEVGFLVLV